MNSICADVGKLSFRLTVVYAHIQAQAHMQACMHAWYTCGGREHL